MFLDAFECFSSLCVSFLIYVIFMSRCFPIDVVQNILCDLISHWAVLWVAEILRSSFCN